MANIKEIKFCPDCNLPVLRKRLSCPHCGCSFRPIDPAEMAIRRKAYRRIRIRLTNGLGQITYIKNPHLRKPYRVVATVGKTTEGKLKYKLLKPQGYFHTYKEAYEALLRYHENTDDS